MNDFFNFSAPVNRKFLALLFVFSFAVMAVLMYCSPFMSDDFEFSSFDFQNLGEVVDYALHYGNGRLIGNVGNVYLLGSLLLRLAVKAGVTAGLIVLVPLALKLKNKLSYLLSFLLFLGVAPSMFAQIYTWTSGFQNYVPSLLILVLCYMLWNSENTGPAWKTLLKALAVFVLSFGGQLYVEHSSILSVVLGLGAVIYAFRADRSKRLVSLVYLAGAVLGGLIMFLVPRVFEITYEFSVVYRRVFLDSFSSIVTTVYGNLLSLTYFFAGAVPLCLALGLGLYALLRKTGDRWKNKALHKAAELLALVFPLYTLLNRVFFQNTTFAYPPRLNELIFALLCLGFLFVLICAAAHLENKRLRAFLYICTGAAIFSMAPLLIVSPIGERCVFQSYFFLAAAALLMLEELSASLPEDSRAIAGRCGSILCLLLSFFLLLTFLNIHRINTQRIDYIEDKLSETPEEINICLIPSDYVFYDGPHYFGTWYYNEERHDIRFSFSEYQIWQAKRQAEGWFDQK